MTKKHYVAIAAIFRQRFAEISPLTSDRHAGYIQACRAIAFELALYFQTENKQFDRARFLNACGIEETN